jgi:hypothetical protein
MIRSLHLCTIILLFGVFSLSFAKSEELIKGKESAVFLIETTRNTEAGSGTGFACVYRDQEFVATNLHVIDAANTIKINNISGNAIAITEKIIVSENADICLIAIKGKFSDYGITPLQFMEKVAEETQVNDEIVCLGNTLGNGVITTTKGVIKAYGNPRLEISAPVVKGNSGGPILHIKTGKVISLVTEAVVNKLSFDELDVAASKSENSEIEDISYFGHRVDAVSKWAGTSIAEYQKQSTIIAGAVSGLVAATFFMVDKPGWENDTRLTTAWKDYSKFLDQAAARTKVSVKLTEYMNDFGVIVRRDVKVKSMSVAQADYDAAYARFKRAIDWKIKSDQEALLKSKPLGYLQTENKKFAVDFSDKVIQLFGSL